MSRAGDGRLDRWDATVLATVAGGLARVDAARGTARDRARSLSRRGRPPTRGSTVLAGVLALVLLSGLVAAGTQRERHAATPPVAAGPEAGADAPPRLGPAPGETAAAYLAAAGRRLRDAVLAHPDRDTTALVSFTAALTPAQAGRLLGPLRSSTAFADAGSGGLSGAPGAVAGGVRGIAAVGDLARTAPAGLRAVARQLLAAASELEQLAARAPGPALAAQRVGQRRLAAAYRRQAAVLLRGSCLIGVVVRGTARRLAEVAARAGVRAVDPAPAGVPEARLDVRPLLPQAAAG